ncbi:hypothetical protein CG716_23985 [Mycolicibacterium sphagni]|uniref:Uncharacterized protein n=1 Tax=Mycolicibacterium sphagni TaxID=1786 RepID=A0A255D962_9MYCO|nr:hypothetical protein CG716_23985 [Mycolicibacterium sphagni]
MTFAWFAVDAAYVHPDSARANTVSVWRGRYSLPFAICQCGWRGKHRVLVRGARRDAHLHAAKVDHPLSRPLDLWKAARLNRRRVA